VTRNGNDLVVPGERGDERPPDDAGGAEDRDAQSESPATILRK
jgi:hypothetical protein